ncbi:MAG: G-D-S-L family lipolytic protein [Cyclobacteriaceae bacterium]
MSYKSLFPVLLVIISLQLIAQESPPFLEEVQAIKSRYLDGIPKQSYLFVGSSSIRFWKDIQQLDESKVILNHGFGGSQTDDLIRYIDDLVLSQDPVKVFVYEGDNDIAKGKTTDEIVADFQLLITKIRAWKPSLPIVIISPKPSISRANLRDKYEELNNALNSLTSKYDQLFFADVWTPMLDDEGQIRSDIFIEDNLHMNAKGYAIWSKVLLPFVN